tara:strand:+ start:6180 stop:6728 length:549 start_codon:yes stop_codon:yes gene_type:complete
MNIHPSHSRKDLIEVCEVFNIEIEDLYDLPKISLSNLLEQELEGIPEIEPEYDYYFVDNKNDLRRYLSEPNQCKNVTMVTKEKVMKDSRKIIAYCKSAYNIFPHFESKEEVYDCAKIVAEHCDISTCRRSIKLLNEDRSMPHKIEPIISSRMRKQLERKELVKKTTKGQFRSRTGSFKIDFS